ncbi:exopolysaccharide biosynthesis protein [Microbulbifer agarilyticus]|uniref:exopolysaccharide biosynthesis protein n=1 Tax=Microbulbifer agarilyticus TaxID=260552 RepID=UPI001C950A46|nr:exopolysaccharide biosynthesis protein [Microbulbifer agarilyticus]MBY6212189.1 exopolysaccharide biosynthesis protein [Microbulbifer agarilyticus]
MPEEIQNLSQLLQKLETLTTSDERITLERVLNALGERSFAPVLLLIGLILLSPLSGIPGLPTLMGIFLLLVSTQMVMLRHHLWLPKWLLARSIPKKPLIRSLHWFAKPAAHLDHWLRPRLGVMVYQAGSVATAGICIPIALLLPVMEVIPFSASLAGLALITFGLALVARDGALELIAFVLTGAALALIPYYFL